MEVTLSSILVALVTSFRHSFTTSHTMTRILVFGAGAVGAIYVYTFIQAGAEVTAVCRSNYEVVKRELLHDVITLCALGTSERRPSG